MGQAVTFKTKEHADKFVSAINGGVDECGRTYEIDGFSADRKGDLYFDCIDFIGYDAREFLIKLDCNILVDLDDFYARESVCRGGSELEEFVTCNGRPLLNEEQAQKLTFEKVAKYLNMED